MLSPLAFRSRDRNLARATAAPAAFSVIASRPRGDDAADIVLRDLVDIDPARVRGFAMIVLDAAVRRYGPRCDVQVLDLHGMPVFFATAGGASWK